jgi:hypothetical protein
MFRHVLASSNRRQADLIVPTTRNAMSEAVNAIYICIACIKESEFIFAHYKTHTCRCHRYQVYIYIYIYTHTICR